MRVTSTIPQLRRSEVPGWDRINEETRGASMMGGVQQDAARPGSVGSAAWPRKDLGGAGRGAQGTMVGAPWDTPKGNGKGNGAA